MQPNIKKNIKKYKEKQTLQESKNSQVKIDWLEKAHEVGRFQMYLASFFHECKMFYFPLLLY